MVETVFSPIARQRQDIAEWIKKMESDEWAEWPKVFSKKDLIERSWSPRAIREVLGSPDQQCENPHYPGTSPMLLWQQDRVIELETRLGSHVKRTRRRKWPGQAATAAPDKTESAQ